MKPWFLLALAIAPTVVTAEDLSVAPATPNMLDPVIVTATRTPVAASDAFAATIVIDRQQIERTQATDVADILSRQAGIEIGRSGGPGQPASLFVRGGNSNYTLLLIDGVRVNEGALGLAAFNNVAPEMIERIEVVEGPRSALYGADAIGGVINLITRQPGPTQLDANLGGGAYGTLQGGAAIRTQGQLDGHDYGFAFGAQQQRSDGLPTFVGSDDDRSFRNRTLNGRASLELGGVHLEARGWDAGGNTQYSNATFDSNFNFTGFAPLDHDFHNQTLALEASTQLLSNWLSQLTLSRGEDHLSENQSSDYVRTIRPGADWHNVVELGEHNRLSFGALGYRERVDASSFGSAINESRSNAYGYLQDELHYGAHHALAAVSYLHDSHFGERFNWNTEYGYQLFSTTRLIAMAGTAFHAPTADDRFVGFGGNPDLKPEKAFNYEFAARQQLDAAQQVELRLFRSDVRDLIVFVPPNFTATNVQHTRSDGVQLGWNYSDADWTAHANGIWQDPRNRDTHTQLLRRARLGASADVVRRLGRFDLGAALRTQSQRADSDAISFAPTTDGGYALFDLSAGARLTRELRLDVRVDNVLNHHYESVAGYNQPGAAAYATLRYSLPL
jgi:vitamin B12 transporter